MKKRNAWVAVMLALALLLPACPPHFALAAPAGEGSFSGGTGTAEDPYQISTAGELRLLSQRVNAGDEAYSAAHYLLTADVNLSEALCREDAEGEDLSFPPIGNSMETPFRGTLDGGCHVISGLRATGEAEAYGLFGVVDGGTVRDLTVVGEVYGPRVAGGVVGRNHGGRVVNCVANCGVSAVDHNHRPMPSMGAAGGLVGINEAGGLVANSCYVNAFGDRSVYGLSLVCVNEDDSRVVNCYSSGNNQPHFYQGSWENCYTLARNDGEDCDGFFEDESGALTPGFVERWPDLRSEDPPRRTIINGETTLLGALNAWVDAQEPGEYRRWTQRRGEYPLPWAHCVVKSACELGEYIPWGERGQFSPITLDGYGFLPFAPSDRSVFATGRDATLWVEDLSPNFRLYDVLFDGVSVGPVSSYTFPADGVDHALTARYVWTGSFDNFTRAAPYKGYADVDENAWYGSNGQGAVEEATRLGLFNGDQLGNFRPEGELSLAEAVKLAAVVRDTYRGEGYPFDQSQGEHWYDTYVDYALDCGIFRAGEFDELTRPAQRRELAHIFYNSLPYLTHAMNNGPAIVGSGLEPTDMSQKDHYYTDVLFLYVAGVLWGSDALGRFRPNDSITRAEVAAIVTRLAVPERRSRPAAEEVIERTARGAEHTAVLSYTQPHGVRDYALYLVKHGTGEVERLVLPSTHVEERSDGSLYCPTDRAPDVMEFDYQGKILTYRYLFEEALASGDTLYHGRGDYTYKLDTETGKLTVDYETWE